MTAAIPMAIIAAVVVAALVFIARLAGGNGDGDL
jgi:hypothetical protein